MVAPTPVFGALHTFAIQQLKLPYVLLMNMVCIAKASADMSHKIFWPAARHEQFWWCKMHTGQRRVGNALSAGLLKDDTRSASGMYISAWCMLGCKSRWVRPRFIGSFIAYVVC